MPAGGRRLATFLFLDIVGSTRIASEIGDERWKALLNRFRRIVRAELKRFGGREEDTAGDGFFATFTEPASALHASAAIVGSVQSLGIDVRCGVHTGEGEVVDGHLAGLGVHVAARVMALGAAAEVLVSSTVKDLVLGADVAFEDRAIHELKGVPGTWHVYAVTAVGGAQVGPPLGSADAATKLTGVVAEPVATRTRWFVVTAAVVALALVVGGAAVLLRDDSPQVATVPSMVRFEALPDGTIQRANDVGSDGAEPGWMGMADGTLWEADEDGLSPHDVTTGAAGRSVPWPKLPADDVQAWGFGFGSAWVAYPAGADGSKIYRVDTTSGRLLDTFTLPGAVQDLDGGTGGLWVMSDDGFLRKIDPAGDRVAGRWAIDGVGPGAIVPTPTDVWISDPTATSLYRFDIAEERVTTTANVEGTALNLGPDDVTGSQVWLVSDPTSTISSVSADTGDPGSSVGMHGAIAQAVVGLGAVWVAGGPNVFRYDISTRETTEVAMPPGFLASKIAVDPATGSIWVGNCACPDYFGVSPTPTP